MPRCARNKIENGIYHICVRGNNRQDIFQDTQDRKEYLERLRQYKERYKMHIYAYCLMTNHVHLLIYDNNEDISKFMQGLSLSYVIYFNKKYSRSGHLFQDRFTSVLARSGMQILQTAKYIHLNPVKAGLVTAAEKYDWSSFSSYLNSYDELGIVNTEFLEEIALNHESSLQGGALTQYMNNVDMPEEGEIATTEEDSQELCGNRLCGIKKMDYEEAYDILKKRLEDNRPNKINYSVKVRGVLAYLTGLISRLTWSEIARKMNICIYIVYRDIKKISWQMVHDRKFCNYIDGLIYSL